MKLQDVIGWRSNISYMYYYNYNYVVPRRNDNTVSCRQMMIFATASLLLLISVFFCTDPPIDEYKRIYRSFQNLSRNKVSSFNVADHFWKSYKIPYSITHYIVEKRATTSKFYVTEDEFLDLMVRFYHTQAKNIPGRVDIFKKIDKTWNDYISCYDTLITFNEANVPQNVLIKMQAVLEEMEFSEKCTMDFFDFLTFMHKVDPEEVLTI